MVLRVLFTSYFLLIPLTISLRPEYVVQGHRFNIFEDIGCYPFSYNTPLTFVLLDGPPTVISIVSGLYSGSCS